MLLRSLAAIGLAADNGGSSSADWIVRIAGEPGKTFSTPHGTYKRVDIEGGAQVWIDIGAPGSPLAGKMVGMTPFHDGVGAVKVEVRGAVVLDSTDPLAGGWQVVLPALAEGDLPLPVTIEIVPFRLQTMAAPVFSAYLRIVGLASEATVYPSPAAFLNRAPINKLVSVGGVSPLAGGGQEGADQRCEALVTGCIEETRQFTNPLSGQPYFLLVVMTDRGRINVLAGGRTLLGAAPVKGAVVQAKARLVATPATAGGMTATSEDTPPAEAVHPSQASRQAQRERTTAPPDVTASLSPEPKRQKRRSGARL